MGIFPVFKNKILRASRDPSWGLSAKEAIALQRKWDGRVLRRGPGKNWKTVAGADLAFDDSGSFAYAGVVLFEFPSLREIERVWVKAPVSFPYVPGLLSFREGPALLQAFARLRHAPDLVMIDGQGLAHPRRFGIASHLGLLLDLPTVGCAKSRLCGSYREPGPRRGAFSLLQEEGETIGAVLRTRDRCRPLFVSIGHKINLKAAIRAVLACHGGYRIPTPTREADLFVGRLKREKL